MAYDYSQKGLIKDDEQQPSSLAPMPAEPQVGTVNQAQPIAYSSGQPPPIPYTQPALPAESEPPPSHDTGPAETSKNKFVNFDRVMNANRDTAKRMNEQLNSNLAGQAQTAQSALTGVSMGFHNAVQQGAGPGLKYKPQTGGSYYDESIGQNINYSEAPEVDLSQAPGEYSGPEDISKFAGYQDAIEKAGAAQTALQAAQTDAGRQALVERQLGGNAFDAALMGGVQNDALAGLNQKYGNLDKAISGMGEQASKDVDAAKAKNAFDRQQYAAAKASDDAGKAAVKERQDAATARDQKYDEDRAGKGTYEDYTTGHQAENTVQDIATGLSPLDNFLHAIGQRSLTDIATNGAENMANKNFNTELNSHRVRLDRAMGALPEDYRKKVWDSLTTDELRALEKVAPSEQATKLMQRAKQLAPTLMKNPQQTRFTGLTPLY